MKIYLLILLVFITGCTATIKQDITPIEIINISEICLIENPKIKKGFLQTYRTILENKGYTVKILDQYSHLSDCKITSTYVARWRWDIAVYMSYAKIDLIRKNRQPKNIPLKISPTNFRLKSFKGFLGYETREILLSPLR